MKDKMTIDDLAVRMDRGFRSIDKRFEYIDQKFEGVGQQFESLAERVDIGFDNAESTMKHNHAELSTRLTGVERRLGKVEDILEPNLARV
jgi:hypothetical protein